MIRNANYIDPNELLRCATEVVTSMQPTLLAIRNECEDPKESLSPSELACYDTALRLLIDAFTIAPENSDKPRPVEAPMSPDAAAREVFDHGEVLGEH